MLVSKYEWGGVESVGAYHERERLCPEGMWVWEIAHVHYGCGVRRCVKSLRGVNVLYADMAEFEWRAAEVP